MRPRAHDEGMPSHPRARQPFGRSGPAARYLVPVATHPASIGQPTTRRGASPSMTNAWPSRRAMNGMWFSM